MPQEIFSILASILKKTKKNIFYVTAVCKDKGSDRYLNNKKGPLI